MNTRTDQDTASSDAALVKRVQEGDTQAYNVLVLRYQHRVCDIAKRFVNNSSDAADVAQEAFIKAYRALGSFRGDSSFYTWLYRIVVNCAKSFLESNSKHRYNIDVDAPEYEDIALAMKTPIGTVRSRIFRARQFIEEQMAGLTQGK